MQELTFTTLIAVLQEMFGSGLFWTLVVVAVLVTLAYLYVLLRDRAVSWRKFLWAQVAMPIGAVAIDKQSGLHVGIDFYLLIEMIRCYR